MNFSELTVRVGTQDVRLFLQDGFFDFKKVATVLHRHLYAEVHLLERGSARFLVNDAQVVVEPGEFFVIPPGVFHKCAASTPAARHIAFQVGAAVEDFARYRAAEGVPGRLLREIEGYQATGAGAGMAAYLAVLCAEFLPGARAGAAPIQDRAFIIYEFLANNYNLGISLGDLAAELNLSEKQTERLVVRHTGQTFSQALITRRAEAAKKLIESGVSRREAAERVGYRSYSGFWKAVRSWTAKEDRQEKPPKP